MPLIARPNGLWVVMARSPGPDGDFVELEDQDGRGVGPESGVDWRQEGALWLLGPFGPSKLTEAQVRSVLGRFCDIAAEALERQFVGEPPAPGWLLDIADRVVKEMVADG